MPLIQTQLNGDILRIKILHSRLANHRSLSLAYHTGNVWYQEHLHKKSYFVGVCIEILERYNADGTDTIENVISNADVEAIIDSCYRELEEWNI